MGQGFGFQTKKNKKTDLVRQALALTLAVSFAFSPMAEAGSLNHVPKSLVTNDTPVDVSIVSAPTNTSIPTSNTITVGDDGLGSKTTLKGLWQSFWAKFKHGKKQTHAIETDIAIEAGKPAAVNDANLVVDPAVTVSTSGLKKPKPAPITSDDTPADFTIIDPQAVTAPAPANAVSIDTSALETSAIDPAVSATPDPLSPSVACENIAPAGTAEQSEFLGITALASLNGTVDMTELEKMSLTYDPGDESDAGEFENLGDPAKPTPTPKPEDPKPSPTPKPEKPGKLTPSVAKLLKMAKEEANRECRTLSGKTVCKRGSKRACLQGVRMAFQRAAGQSTGSGWTYLAKNAGPFLPKYGYEKSPKGKYNEYTAPPGSVLIYDVPGEPKKAGHIEIKGEDGYYSDFYSKTPITVALGKRRRLIAVYVPGK